MRFTLSDPSTGFELKLPLSAKVCARIAERVTKLGDDSSRRLFTDRLSAMVLSCIDLSADLDLNPPSKDEIDDAEEMASRLNIPIPPQALRFRYAMHEFLAVDVPSVLIDRIRRFGEAERDYRELLEALRFRTMTRGIS